MSEEHANLSIGGLADIAGVGVETIRYYQRRGLLPEPARPPGGIRRYGEADLQRLVFIKSAQRLGFSLEEVAELLRLDDGTHCSRANALAAHKLADVREKIAGLQRIEEVLAELVSQCNERQSDVACPVIQSLYEGNTGPQKRA